MVSDKSQKKSQFVRKDKIGNAGRMCKGLTFCGAKRFKLSILKLIRRKAQRKKRTYNASKKKKISKRSTPKNDRR